MAGAMNRHVWVGACGVHRILDANAVPSAPSPLNTWYPGRVAAVCRLPTPRTRPQRRLPLPLRDCPDCNLPCCICRDRFGAATQRRQPNMRSLWRLAQQQPRWTAKQTRVACRSLADHSWVPPTQTAAASRLLALRSHFLLQCTRAASAQQEALANCTVVASLLHHKPLDRRRSSRLKEHPSPLIMGRLQHLTSTARREPFSLD